MSNPASSSDAPLPVPTRQAGLERLREFAPRAARHYADFRNTDEGPGPRRHVSALSPYIRHRLVTESDVVTEILKIHRLRSVEKFVQEVCWRTYWKGWMELRPSAWTRYRGEVAELGRRLDSDAALRDRYEAVVSGRSGIGCVDTWTNELIETGYLHNHTRMWYASLWIFTLGLPWALGADFFFRHLLDADPASNTLSWRWVAGLHTRGKAYLATASNIAKYTERRIRPTETFAEQADVPDEPPPPRPRTLPPAERMPTGHFALLINEDDLDPTSLGIGPGQVTAIAAYSSTTHRSPLGPAGEPARQFAEAAIQDALGRASDHFQVPAERLDQPDALMDWCQRYHISHIFISETPQGPAREQLDRFEKTLLASKIRLTSYRRHWDDAFWPYATAGFFPFKEHIPEVLGRLGFEG